MWSFIIPAIAALAGSLFSKKGSSSPDPSATASGTGDATLQSLLPQLQQLIALQQRQSLYTDPGAATPGQTVPQGAVPLQGAIARMAFGMLPNWAQQGFDVPSQTAQWLPPGSPAYRAPGPPLSPTPDPGQPTDLVHPLQRPLYQPHNQQTRQGA